MMWSDIVRSCFIPVSLRTEAQIKNVAEWEKYVVDDNINFDALSKTPLHETLPTIWLSIPEPNVLDVSLSLYDRAGNESEPISLKKPAWLKN